jgi:hypothetical protein
LRANRQAASASGLRVAVSVVLREYEPLKRGAPRQRRYGEKVGPPTMKGEYLLGVNDTFTFGRSSACTCCLDPKDVGISRIAGAIVFEFGSWWIVNRSERRSLHVADNLGFSVPLPVSRPGWPAVRRAVDPAGLRVLVTGDEAVNGLPIYELHCIPTNPHEQSVVTAFTATGLTKSITLDETDGRKEALVALVADYLQPVHGDIPRPRTYDEIAAQLGITPRGAEQRIAFVRDKLKDAGVPGLEERDARRPLAEWLLALRLIVPDDLQWLNVRLERRRRAE